MALDTLRTAVWTPSDVPLDRAGRRLPGWRNRPVRAELHPGRDHRRFRSVLAADRGGLVCTADDIPADRWLIFLRHGNVENCRSCRWKSHSQPDGKRQAFFHRSANSFPTASQFWQFTHIPTTPTAATIILFSLKDKTLHFEYRGIFINDSTNLNFSFKTLIFVMSCGILNIVIYAYNWVSDPQTTSIVNNDGKYRCYCSVAV